MATVTIPYGGQSVTVDVSDLASEATLKDIFAESRQQSTLLNAIAQRLGADVQKEITADERNTDRLIRVIREEGKKSNSMLGSVFGKLRGGLSSASSVGSRIASRGGGVMNKMVSTSGNESGSQMTEGFLGALGLGAMGAQLGTLFGIMEEFGNSMANLRRVGTGYADDLANFRSGAAEIGLSLEQFGEITAQGGIAVRSLGDSTSEGSRRLLQLTKNFREGTEEFGYFGLASKEMARLIADEAEIKRGILQSDLNSKRAQDEMVLSLQNQLKLNEQMAQMTGQDIRDRIKASQAFRQDSINAAMLASLNEEQRVAANSAIEGLTQLGGSAGPMLDTAMSNLLAGLPMDSMNDGFSEFAAFAQSEGINIRDALQELESMIKSGTDPKTVAGVADQLANQFKELTPSQSTIQQARVGNRGATALLTARMEAVSTGADSLAGSVKAIDDAAQRMQDAMDDGSLAMAGTAAEMQRFGNELRNTLMTQITEAFDMDLTSNEFPKFVKALADLPSSAGFTDAISFMTETTTMLSGAQGLLNQIREVNSSVDGENVAFMASILGAMGVPGADIMRLAALGLEGDELGPEAKKVIDNLFGEDSENPMHKFFDGMLTQWKETSEDFKRSLNEGGNVNEELLKVLRRLASILPTLPGPTN